MKNTKKTLLFILIILSFQITAQDYSKIKLKSPIIFYYNLFMSFGENIKLSEKEFVLNKYYELLEKNKEDISLEKHDLLNSRVLNDRQMGFLLKNKAVKFYLDSYAYKDQDILFNKGSIYDYIDFSFRLLEIDSKIFTYLDSENKSRIQKLIPNLKAFLKNAYKKDIDVNSKFVILSFIVDDDIHFTLEEQKGAIFAFNYFAEENTPDLYLEDFFIKILNDKNLYTELDPNTLDFLTESSKLNILFYTIVDIANDIDIRKNALNELKKIRDKYSIEILSFPMQLSIMISAFDNEELVDACWFRKNFFYDRHKGLEEYFLFTDNEIKILKNTLKNLKNYDILVSIKVLKFLNSLSILADNFTFSINEYKNLITSLKLLLVSGDIRLNSISDLEDINNIDEVRANQRKQYIEYLKALTIFTKTLKIEGNKRDINLIKENSKKEFLNFIKELIEDSEFSELDKDLTKETLYISFKLFDNYSNHEMDIINSGIEKFLMLPNNSIKKLGYGACTKSLYNVISSEFLI